MQTKISPFHFAHRSTVCGAFRSEDLQTSPSIQPPTANVRSHSCLLPFSCLFGTLRTNRGTSSLRGQEIGSGSHVWAAVQRTCSSLRHACSLLYGHFKRILFLRRRIKVARLFQALWPESSFFTQMSWFQFFVYLPVRSIQNEFELAAYMPVL